MICSWECGNMALNNYQDADFTPSIEPSNVRPTMGTYNSPQTFRFWCQKVLPLVYDNSLSYYELLCKVVDYLNKTMEDVNTAVQDVENLNDAFRSLENHVNASETALLQAYNDLQGYVNTYFNNLDVQEEINNKLDVMAEDGTLDTILLPYFNEYVEDANEIIDERFDVQNERISQQTNNINLLRTEFNAILDAQTSGDLPDMAEVVDARVGADGATYTTLGDAVRTNDSDLREAINCLATSVQRSVTWENGTVSSTSGTASSSTNRIRTSYIQYPTSGIMYINVPTGYKVYAVLFNGQTVSQFVGSYKSFNFTADFYITAQAGQYVRLVCGRLDNADLTPADVTGLGVNNVFFTDTTLTEKRKAADAKVTGQTFIWNKIDNDHSVYDAFASAPVESISWIQQTISPTSGGTTSSDTNIASGYIYSPSGIPVDISAPTGVACQIYEYTQQTVSSFVGVVKTNQTGSFKCYIPKGHFYKINASYINGSDITTDAGDDFTITNYTNVMKEQVNAAETDITAYLNNVEISTTWEQGAIASASGSLQTNTTRLRSGYIRASSSFSYSIDGPAGMYAAVFEYSSQSITSYTGVKFYYMPLPFRFVPSQDTNFRVCVSYFNGEDIDVTEAELITISTHQNNNQLNILCIGNSFSQDSFAYLPPVLNELLPNYTINYGVAYTSNATINTHISMYNNSTKYTLYDEWNRKTGRWTQYTSTGALDRGKTLTDIMALHGWDIIYVQPASGLSEASIKTNVIDAGRTFLRILQSIATKPFTFLMGEWLGTAQDGDNEQAVFHQIATAMETVSGALGIDGYIPIGAAIQNARSNVTLQALGGGGNMLYTDNVHMQSGIPALIATYTIALYILKMIGASSTSLYASTFEPTTENATAINAYHTGTPTPMTHGESVGVTDENIYAAQEVAVMAIKYPTEITDCTDFV